jgi:dihydropteroate synthase
MGILNVTSDSFYQASRTPNVDDALRRALQMADEGADIIDIGAESTRPGSLGVDELTELAALIPIVRALREERPSMPISVDTRHALAAAAAIDAGADIVNDVSALKLPGEAVRMKDLIASSGAAYVLMHTTGTPDVMQKSAQYTDLLSELMEFFASSVLMMTQAGVRREQIIIDPGLGFGKRAEDNLTIMANLDAFESLGLPMLIGASRKGFIGAVQGDDSRDSPSERLEGTLALSALSALAGVNIVRVHDVKPNRRVVDMVMAVKRRRM